MITIGYSTREHNQHYIDYLQKTSMYKEVEIIEKVNNGEKSLSQVYNEILNESKNDIVVLLHDDIEFDTKNWSEKIIKHFQKNPEYGILGLAGTKYLSKTGKWWEIANTMYGIVNHKNGDKKWTSSYSKDLGSTIEDVIIVDGLFIAINKNNIKHNFDETIPGFHFYDLGFTLPNFLDGVKVGVIYDVRATHLSMGETDEQWEINRQQFAEKYKDNLPIDINPKNIAHNYIFIHDQNIILEFEKAEKLSNLYNYTYVFLGQRPVDQIEHMDNVIIARNYEDNIEQYPAFTSYTGWYLLWKNNLINTEYVNLFEYDVLFHENIDQYLVKFYEQNVDMVGYVPFLVAHDEFYRNPAWNQYIIPAIKEIYNFNIKQHFDMVLLQNQNALWSSTSNTTFKTKTFDDYMKWFQPIFESIKSTPNCGHAHERSITYYAHMRNRKFALTNNLLRHLQLNSHDTQGHKFDLGEEFNKLFNNII